MDQDAKNISKDSGSEDFFESLKINDELNEIYNKYRKPELDYSLFSEEDYVAIKQLQDKFKNIIDRANKDIYEYDETGYKLPNDMAWRKPRKYALEKEKIDEIKILVSKIDKIYDHLEFIWGFHRSYEYGDVDFAEPEYYRILEEFKLIETYMIQGKILYDINWESYYLEIPSDLRWKIPLYLRDGKKENYLP